MTPDDLPDNDLLAHADYRCNIAYRLITGEHVTRNNVQLVEVLWLRTGLVLVFDLGNGWCPLPYRWEGLLMCERVGVEA